MNTPTHCPDGHPMTRAQRRMYERVRAKPGYTPSRSSTKRTAKILLIHGAFRGSIQEGLYVK